MEQIAKELKNLGKIHEVLATSLHWLETQGHLKVMNLKERDELVKAIKEVMPSDLLEKVEEGISNEQHATMDHSPHDPGDETD